MLKCKGDVANSGELRRSVLHSFILYRTLDIIFGLYQFFTQTVGQCWSRGKKEGYVDVVLR